MRDTQVDLLALAGRDTTLHRTNGAEYHGRCPLCGDGVDRFWVRASDNRFFCRHCTPQGGDAIAYVMARDRVGFRRAVEILAGLPPALPRPAPEPDDAPSEGWRRSVGGLIDTWQEALWAQEGAKALAWLRARGLTDGTIRAARLGYIAQDAPPASGMGYKRGVAIPSVGADGALYGVRIRLPVVRDAKGAQKYHSVRGSRKCLYGHFRAQDTLLVVEGEMDCLLAAQEAGDLADVGTMAPPVANPDGRWQRTLCGYRRILVCLDADGAGERMREKWAWLGRTRMVALPAGKDITAAHVDHGVDLRAWLGDLLAPTDAWDNDESERLVGLLVAWGAAHPLRWEREGVGDRMDSICEARDMAALRTLHARATREREASA